MHLDTLIVGAGQAGLALSRCLTDAGHDHLLLERGRVAERWRSERPDAFRLLTPNWQTRLPGYRYGGPDPDGFMDRQRVIDFFDGYAASFGPPVRTGVTVRAVVPGVRGGWRLVTDDEVYDAANVVVATGHMAVPSVPAAAAALPGDVTQLHSSRYRNPRQLPDGTVLVVGAGPSGQQIALELARAGRHVVLAAGRHRSLPRRYRGRDVAWWLDRIGLNDRTIDTLPDPNSIWTTRSSVLTAGTQDLDLRVLAAAGVQVTGRLLGTRDGRLHLGGDLARDVAEADDNACRLRQQVDAHVARMGWPAPEEAWEHPTVPGWAMDAPRMLATRGIRSVVWATGYGRDWSWIHAPVLGAHGEPLHRRGVTPLPGLYFLGLRWLYRRNSAFIDGVGLDALHLASHIVERRRGASVHGLAGELARAG